jgi:5'-methylthioadenosine phosphorylase
VDKIRVGVIGGSNLYKSFLFNESHRRTVKTDYGNADIYLDDNIIFIPRHGSSRDIPPHMINHRANIKALQDAGAAAIIGVCMVGSMNKKIKHPSIVIPHDYISLWNIPTFFDKTIVHITPKLDEELRTHLISTAKKEKIKIYDKGVYVQTVGPRLETRAEINLLKNYGDIIGMTMASEATLAQELNLPYAAICTVDNYAHGVIKEQLKFEKVLKDAQMHNKNAVRLAVKAAESLR